MAAISLCFLKEGFGITSTDSPHIDCHLIPSRPCRLARSAVAAAFNACLASVYALASFALVKAVFQRQLSPPLLVTSLVLYQV